MTQTLNKWGRSGPNEDGRTRPADGAARRRVDSRFEVPAAEREALTDGREGAAVGPAGPAAGADDRVIAWRDRKRIAGANLYGSCGLRLTREKPDHPGRPAAEPGRKGALRR